jgi:hypothetical protein
VQRRSLSPTAYVQERIGALASVEIAKQTVEASRSSVHPRDGEAGKRRRGQIFTSWVACARLSPWHDLHAIEGCFTGKQLGSRPRFRELTCRLLDRRGSTLRAAATRGSASSSLTRIASCFWRFSAIRSSASAGSAMPTPHTVRRTQFAPSNAQRCQPHTTSFLRRLRRICHAGCGT